MNERRRQLRIRQWVQVAQRAGMSDENLRKIRRGEISISENAADGIEEALQWRRGSVEAAVVYGRKPEPIETAPADAATPDVPPEVAEETDRMSQAIRTIFDLRGVEYTPELERVFREEVGLQLAKQRRLRPTITEREHTP
jgi:hypothetical protein